MELPKGFRVEMYSNRSYAKLICTAYYDIRSFVKTFNESDLSFAFDTSGKATIPVYYTGDPFTRFIAYNNGEYVSPDRLIGYRREWASRYYNVNHRRDRGSKLKCYSGFRYPKTTQEIASLGNPDILEYHIKVRHSCDIPTVYDDRLRHADKSWKYQSKRARQYREPK